MELACCLAIAGGLYQKLSNQELGGGADLPSPNSLALIHFWDKVCVLRRSYLQYGQILQWKRMDSLDNELPP